MDYRREIDGLRALAILPILVFHFAPSILPLGYLGVDLFFVISGYLITRILRTELAEGRFTLGAFYIRRVRRILPATLVVLVATSVTCLALLLSPDLLNYCASVLSTLTFTANIYFWRVGGYFGTNDELKPLLHMWSLGVEEQFYLVFPIVLYVMFRYLRALRLQLFTVFVLGSMSFVTNIYLVAIGGATPAFFLLPTRAWQFAVGAFVALASTGEAADSMRTRLLSGLGFSLIIANYVMVIPGLPAATMTSIGAGILLWRTIPGGTLLYRLLAYKTSVLVGVMSFSLYLWHWPLIALLKYVSIDPPVIAIVVPCVGLTLVLSYVSWKYIEEPFRKTMSIRSVMALVVCGYGGLIVLMAIVYFNGGFESRHSAAANTLSRAVGSNYRCSMSDYRAYGGSRACLVGQAKTEDYSFALVGNSHAQMYGPAYIKALDAIGQRGLIVPLNGCLPTTDINISTSCLSLSRANFDAIVNDPHVKSVIIALSWNRTDLVNDKGEHQHDSDLSLHGKSLVRLVRDFEKSGRRAFVVGPIHIPGFDFPSVASRQIAFGVEGGRAFSVSARSFEAKHESVIRYLKSEVGDALVLPHQLLCDSKKCYFASETEAFFADSSHLSSEGALRTSPLFEAIVHK